MMKKVLLVDDDPLLRELSRHLPTESSFSVTTAGDGREALAILAREPFDLVVTDLRMPVMDGFQLLSHLQSEGNAIPVLVMTGMGERAVQAQLGRQPEVRILSKPFELARLRQEILDALQRSVGGYVTDISLASFAQLLELERKSCSLLVESGDRSGRLDFVDGTLVDAESGDLHGDAAALDVLSWMRPRIEISYSSVRRQQQRVSSPLRFLVLEAARVEDERARDEADLAARLQPVLAPVLGHEGCRAVYLVNSTNGAVLAAAVVTATAPETIIDAAYTLRRESQLAAELMLDDTVESLVVNGKRDHHLLQPLAGSEHFLFLVLERGRSSPAFCQVVLHQSAEQVAAKLVAASPRHQRPAPRRAKAPSTPSE